MPELMAPSSQTARAALAPPRLKPFAEDDAGFAYFRSDHHHRFLAAAIFRHLAEGRGFLLVNGVTAADGELLQRFLDEEGKARYRTSLVRCRPGMDFDDVVRAYNRQLGLPQEADGSGLWSLLSYLMHEARNGATRVLILAHAEMLTQDSVDELLRFTQLDQPRVMPVMLLASSGFAEGEDAPLSAALGSLLTARIPLERLEPEEVSGFIRFQLNALDAAASLPVAPDTVRAIALAADGSPAAVNRLMRQAMEAAESSRMAVRPPPAAPAPPPAAPAPAAPLPAPPPALVPAPPPATSMPAPPPAALAPTPPPAAPLPAPPPAVLVPAPLPAALVPAAPSAALVPTPPPAVPLLAPPPAALAPAPPPTPPRIEAPASFAPPPQPPAEAPAQRRQRLPAMLAAGLYIAAVSLTGLSLLYLLAPGEPQPAAPPVAATAPHSSQADDATAAPAPVAASPESPATLPAASESAAQTQPAAPPESAAQEPSVPAVAVPATSPAAAAVLQPSEASAAKPAPAAVAAPPESATAVPAASEPAAAPMVASDTAPAVPSAASETPPAPTVVSETAPAVPETQQAAPPAQSAALEPSPPAPHPAPEISDAEATLMVRRGDQLLAVGDIVSARRFFERAALAGDAAAACGLAKSYDPLVLRQLGAVGLAGDAATALVWYRRAAAAGNAEAQARLERLGATVSSDPGGGR
ncbi:MAG: hypothetical protein ACLQJR_34540 [Stellaceae bacterium]